MNTPDTKHYFHILAWLVVIIALALLTGYEWPTIVMRVLNFVSDAFLSLSLMFVGFCIVYAWLEHTTRTPPQ